jgi:uncharacterized Tic20 family protein
MFKLFKIVVSLWIFIISLGVSFIILMSIAFTSPPLYYVLFTYLLSFLALIFGVFIAIKYYKNTKQPLSFINKFIIIPLFVTSIMTIIGPIVFNQFI